VESLVNSCVKRLTPHGSERHASHGHHAARPWWEGGAK
jgi:hypothetical protein